MGIRFVSGKWLLATVVFVAPVMGVGYYAGNPGHLGFTVHAALSGFGSVHGRQALPSGSKATRMTIAREAEHLFTEPLKGPRADLYMQFTHSRKGLDPETQIAARKGGADMMTTGSLPKPKLQKVASLARDTQVSPGFASIGARNASYALPSGNPPGGPTSASLFLSSMTTTSLISFPEFLNAPDNKTPPVGPTKISRGLTFKGETELEYQARQRRCLATAIYFEARGESTRGQLAVAQVVMNRVRTTLYPDTICGVVYQGSHRRTGCQFSFTCDRKADIAKDKGKWLMANELAQKMTSGKSWLGDIGYATHYHANYVSPRWRRSMNRVKKVGRHIFYRVKGKQINDALSTDGSPNRGLALARSG